MKHFFYGILTLFICIAKNKNRDIKNSIISERCWSISFGFKEIEMETGEELAEAT